jgi:small subunit ribosomal protein S13
MDTKGQDFRHIVRIGGADIAGNKHLLYSLRKVKGINFVVGNALCILAKVDKKKLAGNLTDEEIKRLNSALENINALGLPKWLVNRKKDPESGEDKHIVGVDVSIAKDNDIKSMRKMKCYKGIRHGKGLPVRGQRTKSNFRRNKGKSLGVKKKK